MSGNPGPRNPRTVQPVDGRYPAIPSGAGNISPYRETISHPRYREWCARFEPLRALAQKVMNGDVFYDETEPLRALIVWGKMNGIPAADDWQRQMEKAGCG